MNAEKDKNPATSASKSRQSEVPHGDCQGDQKIGVNAPARARQ